MIRQNSKILIIILATLFGLASGLVGTLVTRVYILEEDFSLPFLGEINLIDGTYDGSNVVIKNAKKVVVEQNTKVQEVADSVQNSIVGIYKKIESNDSTDETKDIFSLDNFYRINEAEAEGFVITSDGWLISNFTPAEVKTKNKKFVIGAKYVVIAKNKRVYPVLDIIYDEVSGFSFWQIKAQDLPVRSFVPSDEINKGQVAVVVNQKEEAYLSSISKIENTDSGPVKSSDSYLEKIILSNELPSDFWGSFVFDLNGNILAFVDGSGEVWPVYNFLPCIDCVLKNTQVSRASFGVNYISLDNLVSAVSPDKNLNGALVYPDKLGVAIKKDGAADLAGLEEGDIILSIDNNIINKDNSLGKIISQYTAGRDVNVMYERAGERRSTVVKLGEK